MAALPKRHGKFLNWLDRILFWRLKNMSEQNFILVLSLVVGVLSGLAALILKTLVYRFHFFLRSDYDLHRNLMIFLPALGILIVILFRKYIIKSDEPHDIASLLKAISTKQSKLPRHKAFSSMIGGSITAGFGGSIGLELPIISSSAAIGANLARFFKLDYKKATLLLACGAAGGVSAIFNTPIAAVVFALEVLLIDLTRFSLIPLLLSSVTGTIVTKALLNPEIVFDYKIESTFLIADVPFFLALAVIVAFASIYFTRIYIAMDKRAESFDSSFKKYVFGSLAIGLLIFLFPPLYGEGFDIIRSILNGKYLDVFNDSIFRHMESSYVVVMLFFLFLIILKIIATVFTIKAGGIGGIIAPALFSGAITGFLFAHTINMLDIGVELSEKNYALVGMGAMLAGVLHAPLTGIFMIVEMTTGYELIVPLMLVTSITFVVVKVVEPRSIITNGLNHLEIITHNKDKAVMNFLKMNELIETDLTPVYLNQTLGDLVKAVAKSKRNIFPVLDKQKNLHGIVLLDDIREIMFNHSNYNTLLVEDFMIMPPALIQRHDDMHKVIQTFNKTQAWNLPVVLDNKYVGFISKSKLFSQYRDMLANISED